MWELAAVAIIVLLLILILVIVVCWVNTGQSCHKNHRHLLLLESRCETGFRLMEAAQTAHTTKSSLVVLADLNRPLVNRASGLVQLVNWNRTTASELPRDTWVPSISTVDGASVGWIIPIDGTYAVSYSLVSPYASMLSFLVVNGTLLGRSLTMSLEQVPGSSMQKSFLIKLNRQDVVSLVLLPLDSNSSSSAVPSVPGQMITMTVDLQDVHGQAIDLRVDGMSIAPAGGVTEDWTNQASFLTGLTEMHTSFNAPNASSKTRFTVVRSFLQNLAS